MNEDNLTKEHLMTTKCKHLRNNAKKSQSFQAYLPAKAFNDLAWQKAAYKDILKHTLSTSAVIQSALDLQARFLELAILEQRRDGLTNGAAKKWLDEVRRINWVNERQGAEVSTFTFKERNYHPDDLEDVYKLRSEYRNG